jgi:hypothetical protein
MIARTPITPKNEGADGRVVCCGNKGNAEPKVAIARPARRP